MCCRYGFWKTATTRPIAAIANPAAISATATRPSGCAINHAVQSRGKAEIKQAVAGEQSAAHQTVKAVAVVVGVKDALHKAPAGKARQAERNDPEQEAVEWMFEQRLQCGAHTLRPLPGAAGGQQCENADDQKHNPTGGVTHSRHPDQRPGWSELTDDAG
jgi:hypothetical protein